MCTEEGKRWRLAWVGTHHSRFNHGTRVVRRASRDVGQGVGRFALQLVVIVPLEKRCKPRHGTRLRISCTVGALFGCVSLSEGARVNVRVAALSDSACMRGETAREAAVSIDTHLNHGINNKIALPLELALRCPQQLAHLRSCVTECVSV